nr:MAG TPA: hypothetical protein [Herelleviridae sp.]
MYYDFRSNTIKYNHSKTITQYYNPIRETPIMSCDTGSCVKQ